MSVTRAERLCAGGGFRFTDDTKSWIVAVPEAQAYQRGVLQRHEDRKRLEQHGDAATFGRLGWEWRARLSGGCAVMQADSGHMAQRQPHAAR